MSMSICSVSYVYVSYALEITNFSFKRKECQQLKIQGRRVHLLFQMYISCGHTLLKKLTLTCAIKMTTSTFVVNNLDSVGLNDKL